MAPPEAVLTTALSAAISAGQIAAPEWKVQSALPTGAVSSSEHPAMPRPPSLPPPRSKPDMPKFLEDRLAREARTRGLTGRRAAAYIYGTLNNRCYMRGSKETAAGKRAQKKHDRDTGAHAALRRHYPD